MALDFDALGFETFRKAKFLAKCVSTFVNREIARRRDGADMAIWISKMKKLRVSGILNDRYLDSESLKARPLLGHSRLIFDFQREMMGKASAQSTGRVSGKAEKGQDRTGRKIFVASIIEVCPALLVQTICLLDKAQPNSLDEEPFRSFRISRCGCDVVKAAERKVVGYGSDRLGPRLRRYQYFVAPTDQVFFWLRPEPGAENGLVVAKARFARGDLNNCPVRIAQIDRVKIVTVIRTGHVNAEIRETAFPLEQAVPIENMQCKMMIGPGAPSPLKDPLHAATPRPASSSHVL